MSAPDGRSLVLVVGVGRSGTSLFAGILGQLGFHIPRPEVKANNTNPRGFGEPRWVVDFHSKLLRSQRITVNDARPGAWGPAARAGEDPAVYGALRDWLGGQLREADAIVVKDPRTVWFLPLWMRSAAELGATTSFVTMLRHPAEIVTSARKYYGPAQSAASRAGAWVSLILQTEQATRGAPRAFVRYEDLLRDWESEIRRTGRMIGAGDLAAVERSSHPEVDRFVDPSLHRERVGWESLDVPPRVRELADEVWERIQGLAGPDGDTAAPAPELDAARERYGAIYAEAEAIAHSSVSAARRRGLAQASQGSSPPVPLRVRIARRIPKRFRRRLRSALSAVRTRS
jgi:hypothetical protein